LARKKRLEMEIAAASADPAVAAEGEFQLERMEREAALQKEILESQKKLDEERLAVANAAGNHGLSEEEAARLDASIEQRKEEEERLIRAKHAAEQAKKERDEAKKDAEDLAKKQEEADKKRKDAAEKLRKQEEEWKRQDIEDARKIIDRAKEAQRKFEKDQAERNKFVDMAPKSSPSFQANSVAEFMFRKEKEIQRETQKEENRREQERREHAEKLNENVVRAINGLGLNENNNELNFEGIGN
jgi:predicted RND superfamily exporter protein